MKHLTVNEVPIKKVIEIDKTDITKSELKISADIQIKPYVESVSETNNGTNSANATALAAAKKKPVLVNEFSKTVSVIDEETVASQWRPLERYSFDLAQLSWLRGDGVEYQNRSFSLIIGFTTGRIYDAKRRTQTNYTTNTQTYSNGTSSSGTVTETEDLPGLSLGERDGGCGASLSFNVYKEYDDFSVTYAMGVSYGFMTDEAKALVEDYARSSSLAYFPADVQNVGGKMTFVNSTDVVDGAWLGVTFSF